MANGGRKRGVRGTKPNYRWTDEDWRLIGKGLDQGLGGRAIEDLGWLPHLHQQQIRNGLNILRKKRASLCGKCSKPIPKDQTNCEDCKAHWNEVRHTKIAQGLCAGCSHSLDEPGSSATLCPVCIKQHRKSNAATAKRMNANPNRPRQPKAPQRYPAFPWPHARSFKGLLPHLPDLPIVDLFGGSGSFSVAAHQAGRTLMAFNDIHPGVTSFVEAAVQEVGFVETVRSEWKQPHPSAPSAFLMGAHRTAGNLTKPTRVLGPPPSLRKPVERLQSALTGVPVTNLDFSEAIPLYDSPRTLFVVDPPWEGCEDAFEFTLGDRHGELAEQLLGIEGEFVLMCASNRVALKTWRNAPFLYWALVGLCKELVVSSFDIRNPKLERISPVKLGLAA